VSRLRSSGSILNTKDRISGVRVANAWMKPGHLDGQLIINVVTREHFAPQEGFGMKVPHLSVCRDTSFSSLGEKIGVDSISSEQNCSSTRIQLSRAESKERLSPSNENDWRDLKSRRPSICGMKLFSLSVGSSSCRPIIRSALMEVKLRSSSRS